MKPRVLLLSFLLCSFLVTWVGGCNDSDSGDPPGTQSQSCPAITGAPWVPPAGNPGAHDSSTQVSTEVIRLGAPLRGLLEPPAPVEVRFKVSEDLGGGGSLSLVAEVENFPQGNENGLGSGAHPVLLSLSDGANEWLPLAMAGASDCAGGGLFCCEQNRCSLNAAWKFQGPAAYTDVLLWEDHQISPFGFLSVNTFPNCRWNDSDPGVDAAKRCFFSDTQRFPNGKLRVGEYVARYGLVLENFEKNPIPEVGATLKVNVIRKKKIRLESGALNLNVILVGSKNIQDSHTQAGARTLNALMATIRSRYAASGNAGISLGKVQVFEWGCPQGGDAFAQLKIDDLGTLFSRGSALLGESANQGLNLFMVSNILSGETGVTLLGVSGAIGGPLVVGTPESGLAFASFGHLASLAPGSSEVTELAETISHEMGHFLGLSHPSEADGLHHDPLPDTPTCMTTDPQSSMHMITHRSCRELDTQNRWPVTGKSCLQACPDYDGKTRFCSQAGECQFNHLMWWTVKNWNGSQGDGSILTTESDRVIRFSPAIQ